MGHTCVLARPPRRASALLGHSYVLPDPGVSIGGPSALLGVGEARWAQAQGYGRTCPIAARWGGSGGGGRVKVGPSARVWAHFPPCNVWVHSSVVRAADCRSAGPWFKSGCALLCGGKLGAGRAIALNAQVRVSLPLARAGHTPAPTARQRKAWARAFPAAPQVRALWRDLLCLRSEALRSRGVNKEARTCGLVAKKKGRNLFFFKKQQVRKSRA